MIFSGSPSNVVTFSPAHSASAASSVKSSPARYLGAPVGIEQRPERKSLGSLRQAECCTVQGAGHAARVVDGFDGIRNGNYRNCCHARLHCPDRTRNEGGRDEWARRIVHQDRFGSMGLQRLKPRSHRSLPGLGTISGCQKHKAFYRQS